MTEIDARRRAIRRESAAAGDRARQRRERRRDVGDALRYLAFINAGDALRALDQAGANFGVTIDSRTLPQLARLLLPSVEDSALEYDEQQRGKVAAAHHEIHRLLLRATAWQETRWR